MNTARCFLVLPAAGSGRRMRQELPKQYLQIHGKTLLQHTLERLAVLPGLERIVLATAAGDAQLDRVLTALPPGISKLLLVVEGGCERMHSVLNAVTALEGIAGPDDWVLVHDAVRPCVRLDDVRNLLSQIRDEPAGGLLAQPVRDTLKRADVDGYVAATLDRSALWLAATPQVFRHGILLQALRECAARKLVVTDEAAAVEALGLPVRLVPGHADNIKITWPEDLALLAALLQAQAVQE